MLAVALSLLIGAALSVRQLNGSGGDETPFEVSLPSAATSGVQPGGAALVLQDLQRAIRDDDAGGAAGLAAGTTTAAALLSALVTNAADAEIVDVRLRYVDEVGTVGPDGAWPAAVAVEWRYDGFDEVPARTETVISFVTQGDDVRIAAIGDSALRTPVWMTGPLAVSRRQDTLVLVARTESLRRYDRLATRAVDVVSRVVTDWDARLVVEVPSGAEELERALDVEPGYYQQIAAVTGSADGSVEDDAPVHVYVNPDVFDGLGPRGREVVLDHETAHVAGDGPTSRAPTWLVEGYADYVALRDSALPVTRTAAQIRDQVRAEGTPAALPGPAEFDTRGTHLGAVYESAWLACEVLAARSGDAAFLSFYDDVSGGADVARELRRRFQWSEDDLVAAWQQRLEDLP